MKRPTAISSIRTPLLPHKGRALLTSSRRSKQLWRASGHAPVRVRRTADGRPSRPQVAFTALTREALEFFTKRHISLETLRRNKIGMHRTFRQSTRTQQDAIAFPYYRNGELVNVKYRFLGAKEFKQVCPARSRVPGTCATIGKIGCKPYKLYLECAELSSHLNKKTEKKSTRYIC